MALRGCSAIPTTQPSPHVDTPASRTLMPNDALILGITCIPTSATVSRVPFVQKEFPELLRDPTCTILYHTRINSGIAHKHYTSVLRVFLHDSPRAILTIRPRSPKHCIASRIVFCKYCTRVLLRTIRASLILKKVTPRARTIWGRQSSLEASKHPTTLSRAPRTIHNTHANDCK